MEPFETISITEPLVEFDEDASQWTPQALSWTGSGNGNIVLSRTELQELVMSLNQLRASIDALIARLPSNRE
jgi:hypothetical protein